MNPHFLSRFSGPKHLALALIAFSLFAATMRGAAQEVPQSAGVQVSASVQSLSMWSMNSASLVVYASPVGGVKVPSGAAGAHASVVSGLPAGISASWSSPSVSAAGTVSWTLTLAGSVYAVASSGTLGISAQITAAGTGKVYKASLGMPLTVSFTKPTLSFSPAITHEPVIQGGQVSDTFTFTSGGSFHGNVALAVAGLPASVAYSWSSDPVAFASGKGTSTLTLAPSAATPYQWYTFTVTATGDGLTVSRAYTLEVEPSLGVVMQLSNSAATVQPNGTATFSVTATPKNGIRVAAASLSMSPALPSYLHASWSSTPTMNGTAATWTVTLAADAGAVAGGTPVVWATRIQDTSSGLSYSASQPFTVLVSLVGLAKVSLEAGGTPMNIPTDFLGLANEWEDIQWQMGDSAQGVNPIYRQLIANLTQYNAGSINIRVGGSSADESGEKLPITAEPLVEFANAQGAEYELAVRLGAKPTANQTWPQAIDQAAQIALTQATYYSAAMPPGSIKSFEIGNEIFNYVNLGLRPPTYDMQEYLQEFNTWSANLIPVIPPGVPLSGPAGFLFNGLTPAEIPEISTFLSEESSKIGMFTEHYYSASPEDNPAPDFLLTPAAATSGPAWFAPEVQMAHAYGLPFRVDELGAISDGGAPGVENTFASALFAIDTLFNYANIGADGVNWQSSRLDLNEPFLFTTSWANGKNTYSLAGVYPVYYGLLFFQLAIGDGAQLLPVTLATPANLTAWATAPASRNPRITLINKDETLAGNVSISTTSNNGTVYSEATVLRLSPPTQDVNTPSCTYSASQPPYTATCGITFLGQTFDRSTDGVIQGTHFQETIYASSDGTFKIPMPVTSAAIVIFQH